MAVWYARVAGAVVNAANTWNSAPDGSGSWLTWPPAAGDILMCNGFVNLFANVNINLGSTGEIRNDTLYGAASGGYIRGTSGTYTITANFYSAIDSYAGYNNTAGTVWNVIGSANHIAGSGSTAIGIYFLAGTLNFTGTSTGSAGGYGITVATATTLNFTGTLNDKGLNISAANSGTATIIGNAIAGSVGVAANNASTGTLIVTGYAQASTSFAAINNASTGAVEVGETRSSANGRGAVTGAFRYASATALVHKPLIAGMQRTMSLATDISAMVPAASNVRVGVKYGNGLVGTAAALGSKTISMTRRF